MLYIYDACALSAKPNHTKCDDRERERGGEKEIEKKYQNQNEEKQLLISLDHFDINNTKNEYNQHVLVISP